VADDDIGVLAERGDALGQEGGEDVLGEGGVLAPAPVEEQYLVEGPWHALGDQVAHGAEQDLVDGPVEVLGQQRWPDVVQPLGEMNQAT
jgi:hypothetical protein